MTQEPGTDIRSDRFISLWLVNQYALRIDQPGITRHATLAKYMYADGVRTTIFASPTHYWNVGAVRAEARDPEAPTFRYTRTPAIEVNGVRRVLSMLTFSMRVLFAATVQTRGTTPDIVLGSSPHPFGALAAWAIARRYRVPFLLEVRDLWPDSLIHLLGLSPRHPLIAMMRVLERFLYRRAKLVITLLPDSRAHIQRVAGRPVPVLCIPNGSDLTRVPPAKELAAHDGIRVMYAGAHGVANALGLLLDSAAELQRLGRHDISILLVGDGKDKPDLEARARDLCLQHVVFRDPVAKHELLELLPEADILVLPGLDSPLYRNGISPNKLFDYLAAARPIVMALDAPSNPVALAAAGVVVAPSDSQALTHGILEVAGWSLARRNEVGMRGRRYVEENHEMRGLAGRLAEALRTATANPAQGRDRQQQRSRHVGVRSG